MVPWIEQLLTHGLDPLSSRQCRAAAKACRDVLEIMGTMAVALGLPPPQQQHKQQKQGNGNHTLTPTHTSQLLTTTLLEAFSKSFRTLCFPIIRIPLVTLSPESTTTTKNSTKSGVSLSICFVVQQLRRCSKLLCNLDVFARAIMSDDGLNKMGRLVGDWLSMDLRPMLVPLLSWVVMRQGEHAKDDDDVVSEGEGGCMVVSAVLNFLLVLVAVQGQGLGSGSGSGSGDKSTTVFTTKANTFRTTLQDLCASLSGGGGGGASGGTSSSTSIARTKIDHKVWVSVSRVDMIRVGNVLLTALQAL